MVCEDLVPFLISLTDCQDQLFQSHKKLVQIMAGFSSDLDQELKAMMENMDSHAREADSYFAGFKSQMERMTTNVKSSFESVSVDIKVGFPFPT